MQGRTGHVWVINLEGNGVLYCSEATHIDPTSTRFAQVNCKIHGRHALLRSTSWLCLDAGATRRSPNTGRLLVKVFEESRKKLRNNGARLSRRFIGRNNDRTIAPGYEIHHSHRSRSTMSDLTHRRFQRETSKLETQNISILL